MREAAISIKAESLPWQAKFLGLLFLVVAFSVFTSFWWLSILLVTLAILLLTGHSGTEIDPKEKTFKEYYSYLFIRRGAKEKYNEIERIFINRSNVSEKMYTPRTLNSSTFRSAIYSAYLKLDDDRKIFLTSRKDKKSLIQFLNPVVTTLKIELVDHTT